MDRFATCGHSCGATRGAAWGRRVGGASSLCEGGGRGGGERSEPLQGRRGAAARRPRRPLCELLGSEEVRLVTQRA